MCSLLKKKAGTSHASVVNLIKEKSYQLSAPSDLDPLLNKIGDARVVMLGEASHGTHEYYTWRSHITKRLIQEKQFNFIAVEGDWPDAYQVNRYIKHYCADNIKATDILKSFDRWPTWMWANWEIAALAEWLKKYNTSVIPSRKIGFYGLDVYSLWDSLDAILKYLQKTDPAGLPAAEKAFRCFEPYKADDGSSYSYAASLVSSSCEDEVLKLLQDLQQRTPVYNDDYENAFSTEQNAFIAVNAEKYYRSMMRGMSESWNIRDNHMFETLLRLLEFHGPDAKVVVWEHNTHIGDARATDMGDEGMYNIGELARKHFAQAEVVLTGFGSYEGKVMAARKWGGEMEIMNMPDGRRDSWEYLLHEAGTADKLLIMDDFRLHADLHNRIGHRAIGVVYQPAYEMYGNYVPSVLPERYDAFIFLNRTSALHALHRKPGGGEVPDTYPFGV
jgi:erythromycin esterase-like protein